MKGQKEPSSLLEKVGFSSLLISRDSGGWRKVEYKGHKPFCNNCKKHHNGNCWATCHNCGRQGHHAKDCKKKSTPVCYECGEKGHTQNHCPKKNNPQGEQAHGRAYVIKEADKDQGSNVVMGTFLLNNRYATVLFDSGTDKSFVNTSFSHLSDINPVRLNTSYEVELVDGRVAGTNIVLKGCTINLVGHLFKIDLMSIELGTFDVIIGMDWLVEQDTVIVCESVQFLGHVIDSEGIHMDLAKIAAIKNGATPTTPTKVRQFLGLAVYYWRFIKGFSLISKPLTKLTQKNKKFEWETETEEAF
nr:hypothetical protein [Tanacetum cinerariifolium]